MPIHQITNFNGEHIGTLELPSDDQILVSIAKFIWESGDENTSSHLLYSSLKAFPSDGFEQDQYDDYPSFGVVIEIEAATPLLYNSLREGVDGRQGNEICDKITSAIKGILPYNAYLYRLVPRIKVVELEPNWKETLLGKFEKIHNQGIDLKGLPSPKHVWMGLNFRSKGEEYIAKELEKKGVLFFPNCVCRLGRPQNRFRREPDFLVCYQGKWGILEVDDPHFHSQAAKDHERDRLFKTYGIRIIEHFDYEDCLREPGSVVQKFLSILQQTG